MRRGAVAVLVSALAVVGLPRVSLLPGLTGTAGALTEEGTSRVSLGSSGEQSNGFSSAGAISDIGRFVAFQSQASNLVLNDSNATGDVFVRDREMGTTTRASVGSGGEEANGESWGAELSAAGRYVVFTSLASNLVGNDTNAVEDIFVHDRESGSTSRLSVTSSGQEASGWSGCPSISEDGRFVAFLSDAANLVEGDTNNVEDAFVHDRDSGTTTRVSVSTSGEQGNNGVRCPVAISADGQSVAFMSHASNLVPNDTNGFREIFVHDRDMGITTRESVSSSGSQANAGSTSEPSISGDGRYVAFTSNASNLVPNDTNLGFDVFVRDRTAGTTSRVSVSSSGQQGNGYSVDPAISDDGCDVAFQSDAWNLVPGDTQFGFRDIFLHDRCASSTTRVSVDASGQAANSASFAPALSKDRRLVVFHTDASNLVAGDTNSQNDVFVVRVSGASPVLTTASALPDPVVPGETLTFSLEWSDPDPGDAVKALICESEDIDSAACTDDTWSSGSFTGTSPATATYQVGDEERGEIPYYAFVCDRLGMCSQPIRSEFVIEPGSAPPLVESVVDAPDPVTAGSALTFTVEWSDPDAGDEVRPLICKEEGLGSESCSEASWAEGEFSSVSPATATYTPTDEDIGLNTYFAYVCDLAGACSDASSETFTVLPGLEVGLSQDADTSVVGATGAPDRPVAPEPTLSRYVASEDPDTCSWGNELADDQRDGSGPPDAFVFLHFFAPVNFGDGVFGASRQDFPSTTTEIRHLAQDMGRCWIEEAPSGTKLKIALGTTNDNGFRAVRFRHGQKWANMVITANDWAKEQQLSSRLSFNGAFDAEPGFNKNIDRAKDWMAGYRSVRRAVNVFYYGDAEGCPSDKNPGDTCTWSVDDLVRLAWKPNETTAFPQIYNEEPMDARPPTSVNAQQWQKLSERAVEMGLPRINFSGGLSQRDACVNHPSGMIPKECEGTSLGAKDAWRDLWAELNCVHDVPPAPCDTQDSLRWTTTLSWRE